MSPSNILATAVLGAAGLYAAYRAVMWLADRVINAMDSVTRFER